MKSELLLKNVSIIFTKYTEQISNIRGNIGKNTIKETINKIHNEIENFIKKDNIEQQVRKSHTSFFISGPNINSLDDAKAAANSTISSYSLEIINDNSTQNTNTQNKNTQKTNTQNTNTHNTNFITKVEQIQTKKKHKLFRVETIKKKHVKIVKEQQQLSAGQALIRNSRVNNDIHIEREIPKIFKRDYFILKKKENLMHAATKHENTTNGFEFRHLQTKILYDSEFTKMRLKYRFQFLCSYSPWAYIDVEDTYPIEQSDRCRARATVVDED